jgi:hypothetical protein
LLDWREATQMSAPLAFGQILPFTEVNYKLCWAVYIKMPMSEQV